MDADFYPRTLSAASKSNQPVWSVSPTLCQPLRQIDLNRPGKSGDLAQHTEA